MQIHIDNNYKKIHSNANLLIDKNREKTYSFRSDGTWDTFEEIIGFPMQFNNNADPKKFASVSSKSEHAKFGRVFEKTIISDNNLVFFEPGKPKFMDASWFERTKTKERNNEVLKSLFGADDGDVSNMQKLFEKGGFKYDSRYYSFESEFGEYISMVNSMASFVAARLGLDNDRSKVKLMKISRGGNGFTKTMIPFYFDASSTKFSEGGSNATTESKLAGSIKGMGSIMREANFLFNGNIQKEDGIISSTRNFVSESLSSLTSKMGSTGDTLSNLISATNMTIAGANLLFPEIWQDSSYKQNITIGFKFSSPYGDKLSIYNNVLFPILCLIALALPRQHGMQGYKSPFLIKCFCQGWFNCDLGMIESIEVDKGPGSSWSVDGLPLEATVSVTIKDLYSTLMMTAGSGGTLMTNSTGLTEYLECMSGIPISHPNAFTDAYFKSQDVIWSIKNAFTQATAGIELSGVGKFGTTISEYLKSAADLASKMFYDEDENE